MKLLVAVLAVQFKWSNQRLLASVFTKEMLPYDGKAASPTKEKTQATKLNNVKFLMDIARSPALPCYGSFTIEPAGSAPAGRGLLVDTCCWLIPLRRPLAESAATWVRYQTTPQNIQ